MIEKITLSNHIHFGHKYTINMTDKDTMVIYDPDFTRFNTLAGIIENVLRFIDTRQNQKAAIHYLMQFSREAGTRLLDPHKEMLLELKFGGEYPFIYGIGSKGGLISNEYVILLEDDEEKTYRRLDVKLKDNESMLIRMPYYSKYLTSISNVIFKRPTENLPRDPALQIENTNTTLFLINYFTKDRRGTVETMIAAKREAISDKRTKLSKEISKWLINTNIPFEHRDTTLLPSESQLLIQSTFREVTAGHHQIVGC